MRSGGERETRGTAALHILLRFGDVAHQGSEVLVAADRGEQNALAIDGDLDLVLHLEPLHGAEIGDHVLHVQLVFAVERQRGVNDCAAFRADRHAVDGDDSAIRPGGCG